MMNYSVRPSQPDLVYQKRPFVHESIFEEKENVEALIDDTIRMIENTKKFIDRLDYSASPGRRHMRETARRLERSLDSLRKRRDELRANY